MALHPTNQAADLNVISLCTGGGGLDLGLELACPSARTVVMVEREAWSVATLVEAIEAGVLAPAAIWSDVRTFNGRSWRGFVDGVVGGIPCQPHSLAGKRLGKDDERDLWSDARRIIVQSGCWFVLIENVEGMLSSGGARRVKRDLERLGFRVEGGLFTASEVGASHQRTRVFILALADDAGRRRRTEFASGAWGERAVEDRGGRGELAHPDSQRPQRIWADTDAFGRQDAGRPAGLRDGADVDDTVCVGPASRRDDHRINERYEPDATGELAMDDADRSKRRQKSEGANVTHRHESGWNQGTSGPEPSDQALVHASIARSRSIPKRSGRQDEASSDVDWPSLFPPGPGDREQWAEILTRRPEVEPAVRRMADGVAPQMDISRVDQLRMLGNGVVPLEAAYAWRTLVTYHAMRGSIAANELLAMTTHPHKEVEGDQ